MCVCYIVYRSGAQCFCLSAPPGVACHGFTFTMFTLSDIFCVKILMFQIFVVKSLFELQKMTINFSFNKYCK